MADTKPPEVLTPEDAERCLRSIGVGKSDAMTFVPKLLPIGQQRAAYAEANVAAKLLRLLNA